jgi:hypothetical protein
MPKVIIENPILNSPYDEPKRHFFFDEDGITDRTVNSRRIPSYFLPISKPKKKGKQLELETEWTADRTIPSQYAIIHNMQPLQRITIDPEVMGGSPASVGCASPLE